MRSIADLGHRVHPPPAHHTACLLAAAVWLIAPGSVCAQTHPLQSTSISHRIIEGDTLEQLARRYLGDPALWPALQSHNQVDSPYRLRPGRFWKFRCA